ncbi:unnamed protein product [Rhizophagus irregularis]|nr:unnamed protein product [Rhizophagus irregularis]
MVCEAVGLLVRTDYELSYKSEKGVGAGTILEDFEEFIKEYYRLTSSNKVLLITVRHLILDDGEESISEENEITPPSKQKKKTSVPKESNLDEIDLMKGEINSKKSMDYKDHCDYETPPPHPNFGMGNSLKVPSSNQSSTA